MTSMTYLKDLHEFYYIHDNHDIYDIHDIHDPTTSPQVDEVSGLKSRLLESLPARQLAVSGPRKVSVFLFKNKKRIRIYDMEGEEEEEEDTLESSGFSASMDVLSSQIG